MSRDYLDFQSQSEIDREWMVRETWCNQCQKPDLGIGDPILYTESGRKFVEGNCLVCNTLCKTEIIENEINEEEHTNSL